MPVPNLDNVALHVKGLKKIFEIQKVIDELQAFKHPKIKTETIHLKQAQERLLDMMLGESDLENRE